MKKEVDAGEAPLELYVHGIEILGLFEDPTGVCFKQNTLEDPSHFLANQRGTWSNVPARPTNSEDRKIYVAHGLLSKWTTSEWK